MSAYCENCEERGEKAEADLAACRGENERLAAHVTNANGRADAFEKRLLDSQTENERLRELLQRVRSCRMKHGWRIAAGSAVNAESLNSVLPDIDAALKEPAP